MKSVMERVNKIKNRPLVLSVTALTSFNEADFEAVYNGNILNKSIQFSKDSFSAGVDGVVSSVFESKKIKRNTSENFLTLTPGIRPFGEDSNDQQRVGNIYVAKHQLVDFIVVGRPIYQANQPRKSVEKILEELSK